MAMCDYCGQEMMTADRCSDAPIVIRGRAYRPVRYGNRATYPRCGDCNVRRGGTHHHGCDLERCPACGGQAISCGCVWAGEEHRSEAWLDEMEERFLHPDTGHRS